jgi:hypothetical protein
MGLMERMKQAEHAAHKGWDDLEGRIRQRWRIYPDRKTETAPISQQATPNEYTTLTEAFDFEQGRPINPGDILEMMARADISPKDIAKDEPQQISTNAERKPIVSIHGKDVVEDEIDKRQSKDKNAA